VKAAAEQIDQPLVLERDLPGCPGDQTQSVAPIVRSGVLPLDLGVDRVDHEVEQLLLGRQVAIKPHRPGVERRDFADRDGLQPVRVGEADGDGHDRVAAERDRHPAGPRLWPLPHQRDNISGVMPRIHTIECIERNMKRAGDMNTRIAIVGAGLGGLTLARTLHVHGVEAALYEREVSPAARTQGGSLDLHPESGQRAMLEAELADKFWSIARPEGEDLRIVDPTGATLAHKIAPKDGAAGRPEVDRAALRDLLLSSLPGWTVAWGHRLREVTEHAEGGFRLHFNDGVTAECDLLVGADGAHSRVRPLVTDAEPAYTGVTYIELGIRDAERSHPELANMVGPGSLWCLGVNQNLSAQRSGDGRIRVSITLRIDEEWVKTSDLDANDMSTSKAVLLDLFGGWDPPLTALIEASDDTIVQGVIMALPVGLRWEARPGVTLVGDAAHLMPPVGEGANQAMLDGAELALSLTTHPGDLRSAVRAFEQAMFGRMHVVAAESADMQAMLLSPTAATDMCRFFSTG